MWSIIYGAIAEILASYWKSGLRNMMVTSDFRPEVKMWPFSACAVKNTQYNICYRNNWSLYSYYEADITFNSMCF